MVSLWPWKQGADSSPASFEKTLSSLSSRIAQTTARLEGLSRRARRFKALWTLYAVFLYLIYTLIVALVLGWHQWGPVEYSTVAGGPVVIYAVRAAGETWYRYRISKSQDTLNDLQKERDSTIEKLKEATKYNSTLQLLEKYGQQPPKLASTPEDDEGESHQDEEGQKQPKRRRDPRDRASLPVTSGRTGYMPPPTANIKRRQPSRQSLPVMSENQAPSSPPPPQVEQPQRTPYPPSNLSPSPGPSYPHATGEPVPSSQQYSHAEPPSWYDRLLDVLLGEDETLAKNRLALICAECRLVNGQAAPGVRTLEEVGRWRCASCGAWNGEEIATKQTAEESGRPVHTRKRSQSMPHQASQSRDSSSARKGMDRGSTQEDMDNDSGTGGDSTTDESRLSAGPDESDEPIQKSEQDTSRDTAEGSEAT